MINSRVMIFGVGGLVGSAIGGFAGYFLTKRKYKKLLNAAYKAEEEAIAEIRELKKPKKSEILTRAEEFLAGSGGKSGENVGTKGYTGDGKWVNVDDLKAYYSGNSGKIDARRDLNTANLAKTPEEIREEYYADPAENEGPEDDLSESPLYSDGMKALDEYSGEYFEEEEESEDEVTVSDEVYDVVTDRNRNDFAGFESSRELEKSVGKKPKLISEEAFSNDRLDFEKIALFYYNQDDVLSTEDDEVIEDVERVIGNALDKYDFRHSDEAEIYVRNMNFQTDYVIKKVNGRFYG